MQAREATLPVVAERNELMGTMMALALGVFVVFIVGFVGPDLLHEAAHDSRHSIAFPCH